MSLNMLFGVQLEQFKQKKAAKGAKRREPIRNAQVRLSPHVLVA
jgi:hypothetical protein